ncbi:MAG: NAD(P)/FAD-dependent oxidoreductase [Methermicoccaceae archaeon]
MDEKEFLETRALKQRDGTYGIVPRIPGGIATPEMLRKIADVAEKYGCAAIKLTGAQRMALVGLKEEDVDRAWEELGIKPAAADQLCVRSIKLCPGNTFCKFGLQDSIGLGLALDERYHGLELPSKFKIGVSGCPNSCPEPVVKDLGFMGTKKGFTCYVGGTAGRKPRLGEPIAEGLDREGALELAEKVVEHYRTNAKKGKRLGSYIDSIGGVEQFKKLVL